MPTQFAVQSSQVRGSQAGVPWLPANCMDTAFMEPHLHTPAACELRRLQWSCTCARPGAEGGEVEGGEVPRPTVKGMGKGGRWPCFCPGRLCAQGTSNIVLYGPYATGGWYYGHLPLGTRKTGLLLFIHSDLLWKKASFAHLPLHTFLHTFLPWLGEGGSVHTKYLLYIFQVTHSRSKSQVLIVQIIQVSSLDTSWSFGDRPEDPRTCLKILITSVHSMHHLWFFYCFPLCYFSYN